MQAKQSIQKRKNPRILFVTRSDSIHSARWINQISDAGFDVHIFPWAHNEILHPDIRGVTVHHLLYDFKPKGDRGLKFRGIPVFSHRANILGRALLNRVYKDYRIQELARVIKRIKPDIIHSLEMQHSGYFTLKAKKMLRPEQFPPWIVTNWGSDIYLYGRLAEHEPKIREVLSNCDYYFCECHRDAALAREYGFKGQILNVMPNTGGFDLDEISKLRSPGPTSERKIIMLKGYQTEFGRALVGLQALSMCADQIKDYIVVLYSAHRSHEVKIAAELLAKEKNIKIEILSGQISHKEILKLQGEARISIGLSISDGISTSMLETIVMGSFPIQSFTSCADEWIKDNETGLLVHPDDPGEVAKAIQKALTDNELVDKAAEINWQTALKRLDGAELIAKVLANYNKILNNGKQND